MTEAAFQDKVIRLAHRLGKKVFHSTDTRRDVGKGFPDLVIVGLDDLAFAELKTEYGTMSSEQTVWSYVLKAAGQRHYLWRPSDLANGTIESVLEAL